LVITTLFILAVKIDFRPVLAGSVLAQLAASHVADPNYFVLPIIFVLVAGLMAALAMPLGPLLRAMPPLRAYAIDIAGSIAGIAAFALCSALSLPPPVWFATLGVALAARGGLRPSGGGSLLGFASVATVVAATSVEAVEIEPRILDLGERLHPDRAYADPRVREIVDDGRAVLRRTGQTYDLIVLALTDSLPLSSTAANLRLESFLYTEESLA